MSSSTPGPDISGRFSTIIDRLCRGLAEHAVRDWTASAFVQIIVGMLCRRLDRFLALKAQFDAGVPPPSARPARAPSPAGGARGERAFDFVPRSRGWLFRTTEQDGAASFWQLRDLLAEPEMAAFIKADPRVGRLLRPLWWMLSAKLGLPKVLRLPPRPPAPSEPTPTRPPSPHHPAEAPRARVVRMPAAYQSRFRRPIPT